MNIKQETIDICVDLYKEDATRMDVARKIIELENLSLSQGKSYAKRIWDDNFDEEYIPLVSRTKDIDTPEDVENDLLEEDSPTYNKDGENYSVKGNGFVPSIDEIYKIINLDKTEWQIYDMNAGTYQLARKNKSSDMKFVEGVSTGYSKDNGGMYVQNLYKLSFKVKRIMPMPIKELIDDFKAEVKGYSPKTIPSVSVNDSGKLMVIALVDQHLGKITFDRSYNDLVQSYKRAFSYFLERAKKENVEKILMITGHDFFNIDNIANSTTSGTPQDNNITWKTLFKRGCQVNIDCITEGLKHFPIDIINVPGNHDEHTSFAMGEYLAAWFRECEHLNIDNTEKNDRKYYKWGKCLLGSTHCRYEKVKDLPLKMAVESKYFSECEYRHFFLGHLHTQRTFEDHGIITEYLPTLMNSKDNFHISRGYVGNQVCSKAFIFDKEYGQLDNYYYKEIDK